MSKIQNYYDYLYLVPALTLTGVIMMAPAVYTAILSFREWDLLFPPKWVGFENYVQLFTEPIFIRAISNSIAWIFGGLFICALALLLAALVNEYRSKLLKSFFIIVFVSPIVLSETVVSKIWLRIFESQPGAINSMLRGLGLGEHAQLWLVMDQSLIPGIPVPILTFLLIAVATWRELALNFLLFLIGLQTIPKDYEEAAKIDGANKLQSFWHVIFPALRPITLFVVARAIINNLRMFDYPWVMVEGGPARTTETLTVSMFRQSFMLFKTGEGAAIAIFVAVAGFVSSMRWLRGIRSETL
jgi:multiple sugar transport system permease protein